jgi:Fe-S cluster assembly scaffold protein SufB
MITSSLREKYKLTNVENYFLVFVDGIYQKQLSDHEALSHKTVVKSLHQALKEDAPLFQQHKVTINISSSDQPGIFLHIPQNTAIEGILHLLFLTSSKKTVANNRINNIIIADSDSRVSIFEEHLATAADATYSQNIAANYILKDNAHLNLYKLLQEANGANYKSELIVEQSKNSKLEISTIITTGQKIEDTQIVHLNERSAACSISTLCLLKNQQQCNYSMHIDHLAPNCSSDAICKTVINDSAKANIRGRIVVVKDAQKSAAKYTNKNLLLSQHAEAITSPELEIYADDVQCSHGATIGQISEEMLWYLQSRGIARGTARSMLIEAFTKDVLDKLPLYIRKNNISL